MHVSLGHRQGMFSVLLCAFNISQSQVTAADHDSHSCAPTGLLPPALTKAVESAEKLFQQSLLSPRHPLSPPVIAQDGVNEGTCNVHTFCGPSNHSPGSRQSHDTQSRSCTSPRHPQICPQWCCLWCQSALPSCFGVRNPNLVSL